MIFSHKKTGERINMGMYHYCPLVDDNSEIYPDDYDCIDEEKYNRLLKDRQKEKNGIEGKYVKST